ncbi:Coiled-coil domain-containing protein [Paragonimus heterotremus]|uniref:Coiled-coil domain-containing protein n=1 Tax=Paragonimus heterotremus TaxID=100268 RepID=A0A8J4SWR8_9TREM|nr:Coiled-coil domain-containing protein [Paragonimus heterotremus]
MHESWYEMEMMNRTEKARYLQRIHIAEQDKKDSSEELAKLTRERDTHMRHCKKVQTQIEMLNDSVRIVRLLHDKARARYIVTPRYDGEMLARKRRLARAIEHLQQDLEDEQKRTASEVAHLSRTVGAAERRLALMEYLRAENWELIRLTTSLSEGLSKAISEYTSARLRHERLMEDLMTKNKELQEGQKVLDELGAKLADVSALYSKMKLERNKCVSLLQASVKLALDTRERLRIHMNEAEIIIFRLQRHDQELARERSLYSSAIVQRDHKRNELCKMVHLHAEQLARREQMRRSIHCINCIFNQTEAETLSVKKAKERSAQIRNERAILLIERNQEVYILQQRIDAQDLAGRAAQQTLSTLDEEQECLNRYRNHLIRYIEVVRNTLPTHKKLTAELQGLTHQLIGSRMELARLMELAEDPDVPGRLRLLGGKDPSQHELWITLGRLERRMAAKEEDMAEKNLTYEAVCRLVDGLQVRVTAGKDDTLTLAMEVNKVKDRLLQLRNYMKTMYAELVVCGAERNTLKEQVINLERGLDIYSLRMRYGFPPSAGLEQKWQANVQLAKIRKAGKFDRPPKIQPMRPPGAKPSKLEEPKQSPLDILQWRWTGAVNVNNQRRMEFEYQKQFNLSNRLASDLSAEINIHRPYRSMRLPPILDPSDRQSLSQRRPDKHPTELHKRHPLQKAVQVRSPEKKPYNVQVRGLRPRDRIGHLVPTKIRPTRTIRLASNSNRQCSTETVNDEFNPKTPQLSLIQSDQDSVSLGIDGDNNDEPQEGGKLNRPSLERQVEESVLTWTEENDMITFEPERPGTNSVQCSSGTESVTN